MWELPAANGAHVRVERADDPVERRVQRRRLAALGMFDHEDHEERRRVDEEVEVEALPIEPHPVSEEEQEKPTVAATEIAHGLEIAVLAGFGR